MALKHHLSYALFLATTAGLGNADTVKLFDFEPGEYIFIDGPALGDEIRFGDVPYTWDELELPDLTQLTTTTSQTSVPNGFLLTSPPTRLTFDTPLTSDLIGYTVREPSFISSGWVRYLQLEFFDPKGQSIFGPLRYDERPTTSVSFQVTDPQTNILPGDPILEANFQNCLNERPNLGPVFCSGYAGAISAPNPTTDQNALIDCFNGPSFGFGGVPACAVAYINANQGGTSISVDDPADPIQTDGTCGLFGEIGCSYSGIFLRPGTEIGAIETSYFGPILDVDPAFYPGPGFLTVNIQLGALTPDIRDFTAQTLATTSALPTVPIPTSGILLLTAVILVRQTRGLPRQKS